MEDKIKSLLMTEYGYSEKAATMTADDLCSFKDTDLKEAVQVWLSTGKFKNVTEGKYQARELVENYSMKYPAALVFIDWFRECPEEAEASLLERE